MRQYTLHVVTTDLHRRRETFRGVKSLDAANKILSKRADIKEATWEGNDWVIFHNDDYMYGESIKFK